MLARLAVRAAVFLAILAGTPALAQQDLDRIAAVVNDEIVTLKDVDQRLRLAMALSNLPDSPDTRRRMVPQVLRKMIDERLQMQEANRLKISMTQAEIENGIAGIEAQSRQPRGSLIAGLQRIGIDPATVREQIRADLTWVRVATRALQPTIRIGQEEVQDRLETIKQRQGQPEYLVAEILLPIDAPGQEEEMQKLAERLQEQLRGGAAFPALARQFSRAPTAANGGSMGWLPEEELDEDMAKVIKDMNPGQVSPAIRSGDGFHILTLTDRRIAGAKADPQQSTITYSQILLPVPPDGPPRRALATRAIDITRNTRNCDELEALGRSLGAVKIGKVGPTKVGELTGPLRAALGTLQPARVSPPVDMPEGLMVAMICQREDATVIQLPTPEQVRRLIEDERLDMLTRRYLRDLRRSAFIDIRM